MLPSWSDAESSGTFFPGTSHCGRDGDNKQQDRPFDETRCCCLSIKCDIQLDLRQAEWRNFSSQRFELECGSKTGECSGSYGTVGRESERSSARKNSLRATSNVENSEDTLRACSDESRASFLTTEATTNPFEFHASLNGIPSGFEEISMGKCGRTGFDAGGRASGWGMNG